MRALANALAITAAALALCAAAVFGGGDRRILVSPPEAIAEDFLRAVWMKRYPQAAKYLSETARAKVGERDLAAVRARLDEAVGGIEDVRGEEGWIAGDAAEAGAEIRGRARSLTVSLPMGREKGEWRVAGIDGLAP